MPASLILSLLLNRYVLGGLIGLGLLLGAYWKGYSTASARCHDAELRAIIATQARDLKAWEAADKAAKDEQARLIAENIELNNLVTDYEKELLLKPAPACRLDQRDVDALNRVRGNGGR